MKPFLVLVISFCVTLFVLKLIGGYWNINLSGNIAMSCMLMFTAIGHFAFVNGMEMMLPDFIPYKKVMVIFTGIIEIAAAVGLLVASLQLLTSWLLILFFILILPANIYAAKNKVDYQKGINSGPGLNYLWFRIPLQIFFIVWIYAFNHISFN